MRIEGRSSLRPGIQPEGAEGEEESTELVFYRLVYDMCGVLGLDRCWVIAVLVALAVAGCDGQADPPDVPPGRFTAEINGTVSDTIRGPVHYRMEEGMLVGLELGPRDAPGLSVELEPQPPELRTYEVVEWELFNTERSGTAPGVLAFLTLRDIRFEATEGTFDVTYVGDEQIGATFAFEMEGDEAGPTDTPSVKVTGALNAPPDR